MVREIRLTQGKVALVDDSDAERVDRAGTWVAIESTTCPGRWYAYRTEYCPKRTVYLHRFIMGAPKGLQVDHADGDGLNCRRNNLRLATRSQNCANAKKRRDAKTSQFKGVTFVCGRWQAQITVDGKQCRLGRFYSEEEAARTYDDAAERHFGVFARPNFPVFVPGRGVLGVVQHGLPLTFPGRVGQAVAHTRRAGFLRKLAAPTILLMPWALFVAAGAGVVA